MAGGAGDEALAVQRCPVASIVQAQDVDLGCIQRNLLGRLAGYEVGRVRISGVDAVPGYEIGAATIPVGDIVAGDTEPEGGTDLLLQVAALAVGLGGHRQHRVYLCQQVAPGVMGLHPHQRVGVAAALVVHRHDRHALGQVTLEIVCDVAEAEAGEEREVLGEGMERLRVIGGVGHRDTGHGRLFGVQLAVAEPEPFHLRCR